MAQSIAYTKARTCSNQASSISALLDCVSTNLLNLGFSSEGQERRYVKAKKQSVAKNAVPACVVPLSFQQRGIGKRGVVIMPPFGPFFQLSIQRKLK
jgi:hypothetical protein